MQENKEKNIEDLFSDARTYLDARVEYVRLSMVEKVSRAVANLITSSVVVICFALAFLFGTVTLALFLSDVLGSYTRGFGCVSLVYLAIAIVVYLTKDKYIEKGIINLAIRTYFNKLADKDDEQKI
jgi:uncharacterized membrane protein YbhN (UPF0104 family)